MKMKITTVAILLALMGGWVIGLGCYPFVTWSPLNCRQEDIDINTGRVRHQRFLVGLCISERITESPISREAGVTDVTPDWRRVNTFSPCVGHSPHYVFHSGIHQTRELETMWQLAPFSPDARKTTSREVLRLWQAAERDDAANAYLDALSTLAMERDSAAPQITVADLPGP